MLLSHGLRAATKSISFINSAQNKRTTNGTTLSIDVPTGTVDGDLMLAIRCADSTTSYPAVSGWTEVFDGTNRGISWRTASSEPASYSFTTSASCIQQGYILTFRNAVYDTVGTISAAAANPTAPQITVAKNNSIIICFASAGTGLTSSITYTLNTWDLRAESTASPLPCTAVFTKTFKSGASGTVQVTSSGGTSNRAMLISINPK